MYYYNKLVQRRIYNNFCQKETRRDNNIVNL